MYIKNNIYYTNIINLKKKKKKNFLYIKNKFSFLIFFSMLISYNYREIK